ncbi:hypothetical protein PAHAL_8G051700 [Panicum hallii]|uniref:Thioredoxin domain-containing protein n=1 Tax=Panicum hallii TaxID=206008 RepID=A0A2S3ICW2_9POAL|nr:hypothetical protein PAHAL_8G051700 [Panicum hallii]
MSSASPVTTLKTEADLQQKLGSAEKLKFATKFQVEALPAFVVMHKFVKKRHVVGTDDLKKAIEDAHAKFGSETKEPAQNSEPKEPAQNCENFHVQIKMLLESL